MRRPQLKAIVFIIGILGVGFAIGTPILTGPLQRTFTPITIANLAAFAIIFAVIMTIWLDKPLDLELFKWPEKRPKSVTVSKPAPQAPAAPPDTGTGDQQPVTVYKSEPQAGGMFPHDLPTEHWNIDFGDSKQTYEGTDLPIWLLAGWAAFIIWAVVYLVFGLPTAF